MCLGLAMDSLTWHQEHEQQKTKSYELDFTRIKNMHIKGHYQENEKNLWNGRKYL